MNLKPATLKLNLEKLQHLVLFLFCFILFRTMLCSRPFIINTGYSAYCACVHVRVQEVDLERMRAQWLDTLTQRQEYLDQQLQKIVTK